MSVSNEKKQVFFHIGLAKTGTTYLQHKFFPKLKGISYIQRTNYRNFKYVKPIENGGAGHYLVSNEFDQQLEKECRNIHSKYPNAKIIVVLRKNSSWIASQYRRFVKNGRSYDFQEFFDVEKDNGEWKQSELYFRPKLQFLEELFGSRPLVLLHDELKNNPKTFFDKVANFVGATYDYDQIDKSPKHASYNEKQLKVMRAFAKKNFNQNVQTSDNYWVRKLQNKYRMLSRYAVLYTANLVSDTSIDPNPLIPRDQLDKIDEKYAEDWKACLKYMKEK